MDTSRQSERLLRVALIDSVPLVRCGAETVVKAAPTLLWVGSARNEADAIDLCGNSRPDVMMINGRVDPEWNVCNTLSGRFRRLVLVGLVDTGLGKPIDVTHARLQGVRGLVPLDTTVERLVRAIRVAADRGYYVDPLLRKSSTPPPKHGPQPSRRPLSVRELQVLRLIAEGRTAAFIGRKLGVKIEAVRMHMSHVLTKLGARDRAHAVARAFELSLLACPPAASTDQVAILPASRYDL